MNTVNSPKLIKQKIQEKMKIFNRKGGAANRPSLWKRKDASIAAAPVLQKIKDKFRSPKRRATVATVTSETLEASAAKSLTSSEGSSTSLSPLSERLSPLSTLVSKFIAENARKIHDSIQDEKERRDFVLDLRESLTSLRSGKERAQRRSLASVSDVIDFFAATTQGTVSSMHDEEERIDFEEHLARELWQNFEHDMEPTISTATER